MKFRKSTKIDKKYEEIKIEENVCDEEWQEFGVENKIICLNQDDY
jgi:hypothetical protein